jgi:hypothetical protein
VSADETKVMSKLSIVLRHFFRGDIRESFIEFKPLAGLNAASASLSELIVHCLISNLVGQAIFLLTAVNLFVKLQVSSVARTLVRLYVWVGTWQYM